MGAQSGAGQGREPRPGLGFLPCLVTQKYLSEPPLVTSSLCGCSTVHSTVQSPPESPRLLWVELLWLLLVSSLAGVLPPKAS